MSAPSASLTEMRLIQAELRHLSARLDAALARLESVPTPPVGASAQPQPTQSPHLAPAASADLADPHKKTDGRPDSKLDPWLQSLNDWLATLKPLDHEVDDSREAIYKEAMRDRA